MFYIENWINYFYSVVNIISINIHECEYIRI